MIIQPDMFKANGNIEDIFFPLTGPYPPYIACYRLLFQGYEQQYLLIVLDLLAHYDATQLLFRRRVVPFSGVTHP